MVETIDGAIGEMTEVLQRMRELCVQAANQTNKMEDLQAVQKEIDQLICHKCHDRREYVRSDLKCDYFRRCTGKFL